MINDFTFDNSKNIGYIKTIYSDVAPLVKVLSIVNSSNNANIDLLEVPKSQTSVSNLNFDQTITVIVKNLSLTDIKVKISESMIDKNCSNLYDDLYDNLYENEDAKNETIQIITPGNYKVFDRVLFSPNIWESSNQSKIISQDNKLKKVICNK
jgi:hypothetical protein